jgi:uncharacterized glyoxalase superfamily protein PhnB
MKNRSVPVDSVLPHIRYHDVLKACGWLCKAFGFEERFRFGEPVSGVQICLGHAYVMLAAVTGGAGEVESDIRWRQSLTIIVKDVASHYSHALGVGARIVEPLHETVYGELQYAATDLEGYLWLFSEHVLDLEPEEWGGTSAHR